MVKHNHRLYKLCLPNWFFPATFFLNLGLVGRMKKIAFRPKVKPAMSGAILKIAPSWYSITTQFIHHDIGGSEVHLNPRKNTLYTFKNEKAILKLHCVSRLDYRAHHGPPISRYYIFSRKYEKLRSQKMNWGGWIPTLNTYGTTQYIQSSLKGRFSGKTNCWERELNTKIALLDTQAVASE